MLTDGIFLTDIDLGDYEEVTKTLANPQVNKQIVVVDKDGTVLSEDTKLENVVGPMLVTMKLLD